MYKRQVLQDKYESTWTSSITDGYKFFADDGVYLIDESPWGKNYFSENEYMYEVNKGLDIDKDGIVTKGEATSNVLERREEFEW